MNEELKSLLRGFEFLQALLADRHVFLRSPLHLLSGPHLIFLGYVDKQWRLKITSTPTNQSRRLLPTRAQAMLVGLGFQHVRERCGGGGDYIYWAESLDCGGEEEGKRRREGWSEGEDRVREQEGEKGREKGMEGDRERV